MIMTYQSELDKAMSTEQFNQVVEAILAGKYSWACVLILRFAGYNPLHYLPYRTYYRILKENCQGKQNSINSSPNNIQTDHRNAKSRLPQSFDYCLKAKDGTSLGN
jgi:hypothetical protein